MVLNTFKSGNFPLKPIEGAGNEGMLARVAEISDRLCLKILSPKQMLQKLPIGLAEVKAGNTS